MTEEVKAIPPFDLENGQMKVLIQVWSDNHGHDETFGTKPNETHFVYNETVDAPQGSNLFAVIVSSLRQTILAKSLNEPIRLMWEKPYSNFEEVRVRIANSEYLCRAVITL